MESAHLRLSDWLGTLARYLYVADLVEDQNVLEVGCGNGLGCEFLANHGAKYILGIDSEREQVAEARIRHALVNVEYRVSRAAGLELEDDSMDLIFVNGAEALRKTTVVNELRRVLKPDGILVWSASSADRQGARGGVSFHEFDDRLGAHFGAARMIAIQPLVALSLVEYVEVEPELELDTSLARLGSEQEQVTSYMALFGESRSRIRPYTVVQLPSREGVAVAEAALGVGASDAERLREQLEAERRERHRAQSTVSDLRIRVAELERGAAAKAEVAVGVDRNLAFDADLASSLGVAPGEPIEDTVVAVDSSTAIAEAFEAHLAHVRDLEDQIGELREYAREVEDERDELKQRIRTLEDELGADRARVLTMRVQMGEWRDRTAKAEGELLGIRLRQGAASTEEIETAEPDAPRAQGTDPGEAVRRIEEADQVLREQRELGTELERGLMEVVRAAAEMEEQLKSPMGSNWSEAKQHRLGLMSSELGSREAEITVLTVGLRALKQRLAGAADELEKILSAGHTSEAEAAMARIASQLRAFSSD